MRSRDADYRDILALARHRAADALLRSDAPRRAAEESHLSRIPALLRCDDERRHRHYLRVDRVRFTRDCRHVSQVDFEPLWAELEQLAGPEEPATPTDDGDVPLAKYDGPI